MSKYGNVAVLATQMYLERACGSPVEAWDVAAKRIFPGSRTNQQKPCPKGAYLGLCEAGLVEGVPRGEYTRSVYNKGYAIDAVRLLEREPALADPAVTDGGAQQLWMRVQRNELKAPNSQMEVVLALWNCGLIVRGRR